MSLWFVHGIAQADQILVAAAASLTDALKETGAVYEAKSRHEVRFAFGASSMLARQIEEGAPLDVFFSADLEKMDALEKNGRLEAGSRKDLLSNRLVLIAPADSHLGIAGPRDLLRPEAKKIALAEPSSVPAGIYSRKYLEAEGLWDKVRPKVVPVLDVRAVLASVESGNVEAGWVYKTDAAASKKVKVVYEVANGKGPKITYSVAVVKESTKKGAARDFVHFVLGDESRKVFKKYGFVVLE